jgi:two-component system, OmpR family, response regulator VicR
MPGLDGFQVLDYVRGSPDLARLKILVLSALPESRLQEAVAAGASDALAKPFDPRDLVRRLSALLPDRLTVRPVPPAEDGLLSAEA